MRKSLPTRAGLRLHRACKTEVGPVGGCIAPTVMLRTAWGAD